MSLAALNQWKDAAGPSREVAVPPTPTNEQDLSARTSQTYKLCRRIGYAVAQGDSVIDRLYQIKQALAELDKRVANLKDSYWPSDKNK
jgi:hypothetical protein